MIYTVVDVEQRGTCYLFGNQSDAEEFCFSICEDWLYEKALAFVQEIDYISFCWDETKERNHLGHITCNNDKLIGKLAWTYVIAQQERLSFAPFYVEPIAENSILTVKGFNEYKTETNLPYCEIEDMRGLEDSDE